VPKKDNFHETVKIALQKEKWRITYDPLFIPTRGGANFFIDLGVERIIGVEKNGKNIAIEIKSFNGNSPMYSFYEILGQFLVYEIALMEQTKSWDLFIAISDVGYKKLDNSPVLNTAIQKYKLKFVIINPLTQSVIEWKN
jgi:hypothetical protein